MISHPIAQAIRERAGRFEARHVLPLWYVEPDNGPDYCRCCAEKRAAEMKAKGVDVERLCLADQSANHDAPVTCYTCHRWLAGHLTDYGARQELEALEENFDRRNHLHCWLWDLCEMAFLESSEEYARLLKVAGAERE